MTLEQRLTQTMRHVADGATVPQVDLAAVRSSARTNRVRAVSVAVTAVVAVIVAATTLVGGRNTSAPDPADTPVDQPSVQNSTRGRVPDGTIIDSVPGGVYGWRPSDVSALPDAGTAPYPEWKAFDHATGRFLYAIDGPKPTDDDHVDARVLEAARTLPWPRSAVTPAAAGHRPSVRDLMSSLPSFRRPT